MGRLVPRGVFGAVNGLELIVGVADEVVGKEQIGVWCWGLALRVSIECAVPRMSMISKI